MPYHNMPWVRNGQLITEANRHVRLDTPAWFAWLETVPAFCYSSEHAAWRLTARREKRRHQSYWYGYTKTDAKLHNIYLGKTEYLTQAHLEAACRHLYEKARRKKEEILKR